MPGSDLGSASQPEPFENLVHVDAWRAASDYEDCGDLDVGETVRHKIRYFPLTVSQWFARLCCHARKSRRRAYRGCQPASSLIFPASFTSRSVTPPASCEFSRISTVL